MAGRVSQRVTANHQSTLTCTPINDRLLFVLLAAIQVCETRVLYGAAYGLVGLAKFVWRPGAGLTIGRDLQDFHPAAYDLV
jgi:hypothetical protein